ncbi:hypothetical protein SAMN04488239_1136 [Ruegeria marina]|uniref:Uncharacterized protein n=1 Tax=Ruegeria marina TaxID=639004 RepID=A0A1G6ZIU7_9RHOB|nr:hypothetical protein SAMN04488239_1136 [Ruegeria marina]
MRAKVLGLLDAIREYLKMHHRQCPKALSATVHWRCGVSPKSFLVIQNGCLECSALHWLECCSPDQEAISRACSRRVNFWIFPVEVLGIAVNTNLPGTL